MKGSKKLTQIAKIMFKNSMSNGYLDTKKVRDITAKISSRKPAGLAKILTAYKRYVEQQIAREEIIIESAVPLPSKNLEKELLSKTGAKKIKYQIESRMVTGVKIKHG